MTVRPLMAIPRKARVYHGSSTQQGYGYAWRKLRATIIARDPVCTDPSGCTRPSTDADHIVARRKGGSEDPTNLRGLCHQHHASKTNREDGGWGLRPKLNGVSISAGGASIATRATAKFRTSGPFTKFAEAL